MIKKSPHGPAVGVRSHCSPRFIFHPLLSGWYIVLQIDSGCEVV